MKTITLKLFTLSELNPEAKEKALNKLTEEAAENFYCDDAVKSLEKFCELFNVKHRQIDFLYPYRNSYKIEHIEEQLNLSGPRLVSFLWSNFGRDIFKPKYIGCLETNEYIKHKRVKSPEKPYKNGNRFNPYYSGCQVEYSCNLTGVCYDMDILDSIVNVMLCKDLKSTLEEVIEAGIDNLCKSIQSEYEYQTSEEGIIEYLDGTDRKFLEDGREF